MGLILLDTSILIDHLRRSLAARQAWEGAADAGHEVHASVITKAELLAGTRSPERRVTRDLMASLTWVDVTEEIAELAGAYFRQYRRSHQGVGLTDFLIGATAQLVGADLWTTNTRHFPMFPGLRAPY